MDEVEEVVHDWIRCAGCGAWERWDETHRQVPHPCTRPITLTPLRGQRRLGPKALAKWSRRLDMDVSAIWEHRVYDRQPGQPAEERFIYDLASRTTRDSDINGYEYGHAHYLLDKATRSALRIPRPVHYLSCARMFPGFDPPALITPVDWKEVLDQPFATFNMDEAEMWKRLDEWDRTGG